MKPGQATFRRLPQAPGIVRQSVQATYAANSERRLT